MKEQRISNRRLFIVALAILVPVLIVLLRSAEIQIIQSSSLSQRAAAQQTQVLLRSSPRGTIYDRNGNVLAVSSRAYVLRVNTRVVTNTTAAAAAAELIAPVVLRPASEIQQRIDAIISDSKAITPQLSNILYSSLSPSATVQLTTTLAARRFEGLLVEPSWVRTYPQGTVAGPTLGFVSLQPQGYSGVEEYYDNELTSLSGYRKERGPIDLLVVTPTQAGADLVLTLDLALQNYVEKRLAQGMSDYQAQGGSIIVMDTRSGAILASASSPGYDPNNALALANSTDAKRLHDPAVSDLYEPGSVIKLLTAATALEQGVITTRTIFHDSGKYVVSGRVIRNSDLAAHGNVDLMGMLQESLNVVAAQVAADTGSEAFYHRFAMFGIGRKIGIDLGNEGVGRLRTPADSDWSAVDLATNSFGQGLTATPMQVLNAVNVLANDGVLMQPYMVQQWRTQAGQVIFKRPTPIQRVVSPKTARELREVAAEATRTATPKALVKGYTVAGKTGTAQWYLRGIPQQTTIVTYVGFLPAREPRITILVKFDQPKSSPWAANSTIPVFHDVAERACKILGVPPDIVQESH